MASCCTAHTLEKKQQGSRDSGTEAAHTTAGKPFAQHENLKAKGGHPFDL